MSRFVSATVLVGAYQSGSGHFVAGFGEGSAAELKSFCTQHASFCLPHFFSFEQQQSHTCVFLCRASRVLDLFFSCSGSSNCKQPSVLE